MSLRTTTLSLTLAAAGALAAACGDDPKLNVETVPADTAADAAAPAPQPAHSSTAAAPQQLPPDHPPLDSAAGAPPIQLPPVDAGAGQGEAAMTWQAPASWISEPPASSMRRAQFRVPGPGGDGECAVFYFGPGQGGDPMSNVERWASQFTDESGQPAMGNMKTRQTEANGVRVLFVETRGVYQAGSMMGMGQGEARPGWALLGAIAEGADANWFFKLTGPQATIDANRTAFEQMIASLRRGA